MLFIYIFIFVGSFIASLIYHSAMDKNPEYRKRQEEKRERKMQQKQMSQESLILQDIEETMIWLWLMDRWRK